MNRLEYIEVKEATEIPLNRWNNLIFRFSDTYYTIVEGDIPLEVANTIYEKYPENPYGIRVNGGCDYCNPNKVFPYYYHIDTKEGLLIFITEMKDYFARKTGLPETDVQRYDELMARINSKILEKVNLSISTNEWMQADEENREIFFQTVSNNEKTPFGKEFRKALDDFDKTINPFINQDIELDEVGSYIKKVNISANTYDSKDNDGMIRKNCCEMHITDLESGNKVNFYRNPNGFEYNLQYTFGEDQYLDVLHYYSTRETDENDRGEFIAINYWGDNVPQEIDIKYNLTKSVAGSTRDQKTPITPDQEKIFYDELLKAIGLASSITLDNMKKKCIPKQLLPNNQ